MTHIRRVTKPALETITLGQLLAHEFAPREDLIFPWLRQGESAMLWAAPGTGKTLLTLTMAVMVAGGGNVLGWSSPKPRKVLLVDGEMSAEDLKERVTWLIETVSGIDREAAARNLMILSRNWQADDVRFPDLGEREANGRQAGQDVVITLAREHKAELVLLDNYSTLTEVADENDAAAMSPTLSFLLRLKQMRTAVVLVHHSGKDGTSYRGSSKLATTFEVILGLRQLDGATAGGAAFTLEFTKFRRQPSEGVRTREVRLDAGPKGAQWIGEESLDADVFALVRLVRECRLGTQKEIAAELGWDGPKVSKVKTKAIREERITKQEWETCLAEAKGNAEGGNQDF